jgi:hypothetical protein
MLTGNRFAILKALCGARHTRVCELARRLGRDAPAVDADARRLIGIGLIDEIEELEAPQDPVRGVPALYSVVWRKLPSHWMRGSGKSCRRQMLMIFCRPRPAFSAKP